jgi:PilZ domain
LLENSSASSPAQVTDLSLRGCFLELSGSFTEHQRLRVKIFYSDEYFESPADVIYVKANGIGLLFTEIKPHFRSILQKWILAALDHQTEEAAVR